MLYKFKMSSIFIRLFVISILSIFSSSNRVNAEILDGCPDTGRILRAALSSLEDELPDSTEKEIKKLLVGISCDEAESKENMCENFAKKNFLPAINRLITICNMVRYKKKPRKGSIEPDDQIILLANPRTQATPPVIRTTQRIQNVTQGYCKPGWSYYNKCCYMMTVGKHSFYSARSTCQVLGGDLASLPDMLERYFVNGISGDDAYWIGGVRSHGKQFMWLTGQPILNPSWRPSQPDGCCGAQSNCILVNYFRASRVWEDAGCTKAHTRVSNGACKYCPK